MLIFNRREVFVGNLEGYNKCKAKLDNNKIKYSTKSAIRSAPIGVRQELVGRVEQTSGQHYIYVHKKDFENAKNYLQALK